MSQAEAWMDGAADDYFTRNHDMGTHGPDPVAMLIEHVKLQPKRILEVGCANGWRLKALKEKYGCEVHGIDPSKKAVQEGNLGGSGILQQGTADKLPYPDDSFDIVIMGFFLFLTEPSHWLRIAGEADRVLAMGGFLFVYDFMTARPFMLTHWGPPEASQRETGHKACLYEFTKLWLGHPCYVKAAETLKGVTLAKSNFLAIQAVTCLAKTMGLFLTDKNAPVDNDT